MTNPFQESPQSQGLWASLTAKIINNLQVTVKNIHIRYEDNMSVPGVRDTTMCQNLSLDVMLASFRRGHHIGGFYGGVGQRGMAANFHRKHSWCYTQGEQRDEVKVCH
jgi:hypothetical protein